MKELLPIGSVVMLEGGTQEMMIISRGLFMNHNGKNYYFDYGGVMYPEGLVDNQMGYFQHEDITQVLHEGYNNPANINLEMTITKFTQDHPELERGNPKEWAEESKENA